MIGDEASGTSSVFKSFSLFAGLLTAPPLTGAGPRPGLQKNWRRFDALDDPSPDLPTPASCRRGGGLDSFFAQPIGERGSADD